MTISHITGSTSYTSELTMSIPILQNKIDMTNDISSQYSSGRDVITVTTSHQLSVVPHEMLNIRFVFALLCLGS